MNMNYDAVIIGSGPNGLSAGIKMSEAGLKVLILEAKEKTGGGMRTEEFENYGCKYDVCSAIHPLAASSPYFSKLPLQNFGVKWIEPPISLAHPFDDGHAALLHKSVFHTAQTLGIDAENYANLFSSLVKIWDDIKPDLLGPLKIPKQPFKLLQFGIQALQSNSFFTDSKFRGKYAKGFFSGLSAHSILPLDDIITASFGLVLGSLGHTVGWPFPEGGTESLAKALEKYFISLGGEVQTNFHVKSLNDIPPARAILFDTVPKNILSIASEKFTESYNSQLRNFKYGAGVFKIDWIIEGEIPFVNPDCNKAGVVHIGATKEEITESEKLVWNGRISEKPFVLLAQQSYFDKTRTKENLNVIWGYCHTPNGSTEDATERIENQIERFAPGFKKQIVAKKVMNAIDFHNYNPNYIGGDINGGMQNWRQLFTRPAIRLNPYSTPAKEIYICSSSTPPGGGIHGMCGYHAACAALKNIFGMNVC